jgi:hypothetical protein
MTLSEAQLLAMPGVMCTVVNTTAVAMQISVKIHRVSIWGPAPAQGNTNTVDLRWMGSGAAAANWHATMANVVSDVSNNPAHSPRITATPPQGSNASWWITADNSGADQVLAFNCPIGSILEFDLEFNHGMPPTVGSFSTAIATGTLGVMYWLVFNATSGSGTIYPTSTLAQTV